MRLIQRVKIAHSFLQSVSGLFHFINYKLAYLLQHMAVKDFFAKATYKKRKIDRFNPESHF